MASLEPNSRPALRIIGTTPAVESVIRRFERASAVAIGHDRQGLAHIVEIVERLAHPHHNDIGYRAQTVARHKSIAGRLGPGNRQSFPRDQNLAQDLSGVRLRTSFWVPVWQKLQFSVQPTWLETHSVPRSLSGI